MCAQSGLRLAAETAVSYEVREERLEDDRVSFIGRVPRIYGLSDTEVEARINADLRERCALICLRVRCMADNRGKAIGETAVNAAHNGGNLVNFTLCTEVTLPDGEVRRQTDRLNYDLKSGKRLFFWDLFVKDGAKRKAVSLLFMQAAGSCGEPTDWVLQRLSQLGSLAFTVADGGLTVVAEREDGAAVEVTVPLASLAPALRPRFAAVGTEGEPKPKAQNEGFAPLAFSGFSSNFDFADRPAAGCVYT